MLVDYLKICMCIYTLFTDIWGFDEAAVEALKMMKMPDEEQDMIKKYQVLLGQESELIKNMLSVSGEL